MYLVMFDLDGTLVNSSSFQDDLFSKAIQEIIKQPIDTDWTKFKHVTDSGILDEVIDRNGLEADRQNIHHEVKSIFMNNVKLHISRNPVTEVTGASAFFGLLRQRNDIVCAIATGGWEETAKLKLESAGIDFSGASFASAADDISRTGIMRLAEKKCSVNKFTSKTYFGDAIWDQKASQELGYNFVLVGNKINHSPQVMDYTKGSQILELIGL